MKMIVTALVLLALFAVPSLAGFKAEDPKTGINIVERELTSKTCKLQPTASGFEVEAEGIASFVQSSRGLTTSVKVLAKVEDRTVLIVSVEDRAGERFDIGLIEMVLGAGVFQSPSYREVVTNPLSINEITAVTIHHKDTLLLKGECDAGTIRD